MKAWQLDRLGGTLALRDVAMPEPRPGTVRVRIEATALLSYSDVMRNDWAIIGQFMYPGAHQPARYQPDPAGDISAVETAGGHGGHLTGGCQRCRTVMARLVRATCRGTSA
jgi:NADPH:quinone reductase-like Zn-dependent oxidoreductase